MMMSNDQFLSEEIDIVRLQQEVKTWYFGGMDKLAWWPETYWLRYEILSVVTDVYFFLFFKGPLDKGPFSD